MADKFVGVFIALGATLIAVAVIYFFRWIANEIRWHFSPKFKWPAKLLNIAHDGSTLKTDMVTTINSNGGIGVGSVTTGHDEEFLTIWDAGKYGRLVVDDETIFRFAKLHSELWLKSLDGEVRVTGIESHE